MWDFVGVILNFLVKELMSLVPSSLSNALYHWLVGGIFSVIVYR